MGNSECKYSKFYPRSCDSRPRVFVLLVFASKKVGLFVFVIFEFPAKTISDRRTSISGLVLVSLTDLRVGNLCECQSSSWIASYSFITFKQISSLVNIQNMIHILCKYPRSFHLFQMDILCVFTIVLFFHFRKIESFVLESAKPRSLSSPFRPALLLGLIRINPLEPDSLRTFTKPVSEPSKILPQITKILGYP